MSTQGISESQAADEVATFRAAHPNGVHSRDTWARKELLRVMLDGADVTKSAQWADASTGEVGVYPMLAPDRIDAPEVARRERLGLPVLDVRRGRVEVTNPKEH